MYRNAATNEVIHDGKISPNAPAITHLLFVNDSFLFFRSSQVEAQVVKDLLNSYERLSGQAVNYQKLGIFLVQMCEEINNMKSWRSWLLYDLFKNTHSLLLHF